MARPQTVPAIKVIDLVAAGGDEPLNGRPKAPCKIGQQRLAYEPFLASYLSGVVDVGQVPERLGEFLIGLGGVAVHGGIWGR